MVAIMQKKSLLFRFIILMLLRAQMLNFYKEKLFGYNISLVGYKKYKSILDKATLTNLLYSMLYIMQKSRTFSRI